MQIAAGGGALSNSNIDALLEDRINVVYGCFVEQREIDIVLKSSNLTLAFNIETPTPTNPEKGELQKHYKLLKNDPCMAEQRLIMIYLAPNKEFFDDVFRGFVREIRDDDLAVRVSWEDVASILDKVLEKEQRGYIPPISSYARHTIKAFRYSIENDYKEVALIEVEGEKYKIERSANNGGYSARNLNDGEPASTVGIMKQWIKNRYGDKYDHKFEHDSVVVPLFFRLYALQ